MIAAHLRKERALTRCRYSVEPRARAGRGAGGLWRVTTSTAASTRRSVRDACRRERRRVSSARLLEDKLRADVGSPRARGTAAAARASGAGRRRRSARRRGASASTRPATLAPGGTLRGSDLRPLALLLGACASRWRRGRRRVACARRAQGSGGRSEQWSPGGARRRGARPRPPIPVGSRRLLLRVRAGR